MRAHHTVVLPEAPASTLGAVWPDRQPVSSHELSQCRRGNLVEDCRYEVHVATDAVVPPAVSAIGVYRLDPPFGRLSFDVGDLVTAALSLEDQRDAVVELHEEVRYVLVPAGGV